MKPVLGLWGIFRAGAAERTRAARKGQPEGERRRARPFNRLESRDQGHPPGCGRRKSAGPPS